MTDYGKRIAVVTGGSSGIGAATVARLTTEGFDVITGARRMDRIREVAEPVGARAFPLDVSDPVSVEAFVAQVPRCDVLVNNAGGALGLEPLAESIDEHWRTMWESNVFGLMLMTRALLPKLEASGNGHILNIGSIAGIETYPGGAGYTSVKHAARAISHTLRLELVGKPVRVTEIDPGLVETEFSIVRFDGDRERAKKVYDGMTPLTAEDIADCVAWCVTRPKHVNIDEMIVRPLAQARATIVARNLGL